MKHAAFAIILLLAACASGPATPYQEKVAALTRSLDWAVQDVNDYTVAPKSKPWTIIKLAKFQVQAEDAVRAARVCPGYGEADCDAAYDEARQSVRRLEAATVAAWEAVE